SDAGLRRAPPKRGPSPLAPQRALQRTSWITSGVLLPPAVTVTFALTFRWWARRLRIVRKSFFEIFSFSVARLPVCRVMVAARSLLEPILPFADTVTLPTLVADTVT